MTEPTTTAVPSLAAGAPTPTPAPPSAIPWWAPLLVFGLAVLALAPTTGDFGLTYDEPAYRYSQLLSGQWWERLAAARSGADVQALVEPDTLLYYWPYGRFGINFHPPLAGQLNLLAHRVFGGWMRDIPARRMASVLEFALTLTLLFTFLARRYSAWVGGVAAAALLVLPRLYGQAHLIDTDTPGLLLWTAAAFAAWKGLNEPHAARSRWLVGVLAGLAFVEKMAAVLVLLPVLAWLLATRLPRLFRRDDRAAWLDAIVTLGPMLLTLGLAFLEVRRLAKLLPPPARTDLFRDRPATLLPGAVLLIPLLVWLVRRGLAWLRPRSPLWGRERPGLEIVAALAAWAPAVAWLGNPAWWVETIPRLAHYYAISAARRGALPDIQVLYFGQIYEYSLPWPNAWVLIAITVPVTILAAALVGLLWGLARVRSDRLPLYCLVHLATLPVMRMAETPGHDGVRLFLPSFLFLAAFAGWGTLALADGLARLARAGTRQALVRGALSLLVIGPAAWDLVRIHPFELSYYNALIGGPKGAWDTGFELTYWYDAFTPGALAELNDRLPPGADLDFPNQLSAPTTFLELQTLGALRPDLHLAATDSRFPYLWLLTHDSKAMAYTRLLYAMTPWYAVAPPQLGGLRVATVAGPEAAARALALQLLLDAPYTGPPEPDRVPAWVDRWAPPLARLWGRGLAKAKPLTLNEPILAWARDDPDGLIAAARAVTDWARAHPEQLRRPRREILAGAPFATDPAAARLYQTLTRYDDQAPFSARLLGLDPEALAEAAAILARRGDAVRAVLSRYPFTDPATVGGPLDAALPARSARDPGASASAVAREPSRP